MSLHSQPILPVPEETARVTQAAFPKGNLYLTLRDELGTLHKDEDFSNLYPQRGQPAQAPWRLASIINLTTSMKFSEFLDSTLKEFRISGKDL